MAIVLYLAQQKTKQMFSAKKYIVLGLAVALMVSCKKDDDNGGGGTPVNNDPKSISELVVPDNFNYETTREIELDIDLLTFIDNSNIKTTVTVFVDENAELETQIFKGSTQGSDNYKATITIPTYLEEVYVRTAGGVQKVGISSKKTYNLDYNSFTINTEPDTVPLPERLGNLGFGEAVNANKLSTTGQELLANGDFSSNNFGSASYWNTNIVADAKWYTIQNGSQFNDGGNQVLRFTDRYGAHQTVNAVAGDLITFSADMRRSGNISYAYLYIIPRNSSGTTLGFYSKYISKSSLSSSSYNNFSVAATMPSGTATVQLLIWVKPSNGTIYVDNASAIGPVLDADNDGVNDDDDDYPNDATRAYNVYYPSPNAFCTYAFEDLWPSKGDYDFNDLVLLYNHSIVTNANDEVVDFKAKYVVKALGGSLQNGFGVKFDGIASSNVQTVTGTEINDTYITNNANGSEAAQTDAVVIMYDDAEDIINRTSGSFFNTVPTNPAGTSDTVEVTVTFVNPISSFSVANDINPFIIVGGNRGTEIHLSGFEPTDLVDATLFGTGVDDTDPSAGEYYLSKDNLPWGIDIPVEFDYPTEKTEIIQAHNYFATWAQSGGDQRTDWYLNILGYRDLTSIFGL